MKNVASKSQHPIRGMIIAKNVESNEYCPAFMFTFNDEGDTLLIIEQETHNVLREIPLTGSSAVEDLLLFGWSDESEPREAVAA